MCDLLRIFELTLLIISSLKYFNPFTISILLSDIFFKISNKSTKAVSSTSFHQKGLIVIPLLG